jgi:hypothetical protein
MVKVFFFFFSILGQQKKKNILFYCFLMLIWGFLISKKLKLETTFEI